MDETTLPPAPAAGPEAESRVLARVLDQLDTAPEPTTTVASPRRGWLLPAAAAAVVVAVAGAVFVGTREPSTTGPAAPPAPTVSTGVPEPRTPATGTPASRTPATGTPVPGAGGTTGQPAPSPAGPAGPATGTATDPGGSGWTTYRNEKYGFSVQVPTALTAGPDPTGGQGLTFRSADGLTSVTAKASATPPGTTLASEANAHAEDLRRRGELTYTNLDPAGNTYTVSGFLHVGTLVVYDRGVVGPNTEYLLSWVYPTTERATVEPWLQRTLATFQPGPL